MAKRIVCTVQDPDGASHQTAHVVRVGIGFSNGEPEMVQDVSEVREKIAGGDSYFANVDGERLEVTPYRCRTCEFETVRPVRGRNVLSELPGLSPRG